MKPFEYGRISQTPKSQAESVQYELDDFQNRPLVRKLLIRLPADLRQRHMEVVDTLTDDEAAIYLNNILEKREAATTETLISDAELQQAFNGQEHKLWQALQTNVFTDPHNSLGSGQTARVKRFTLTKEAIHSPIESVAVKYLISPTEKTLSASGEHDLIREVERIERIEQAELYRDAPIDMIRVPHPYFYYQHGKIQCYGMEEVKGINLEQGISNEYDPELKSVLRAQFENVDPETIINEIDRFFDIMHNTCLHGDIKAANLMVSREGKFYVIDFGQSVLPNQINDKSADAFDNLKDEEKRNAKALIRAFLLKLYAE